MPNNTMTDRQASLIYLKMHFDNTIKLVNSIISRFEDAEELDDMMNINDLKLVNNLLAIADTINPNSDKTKCQQDLYIDILCNYAAKVGAMLEEYSDAALQISENLVQDIYYLDKISTSIIEIYKFKPGSCIPDSMRSNQ